MTDPAAPTTPLKPLTPKEEAEMRNDIDPFDAYQYGGWAHLVGRLFATLDLARATPTEALECDHPPSMLTTSTYNGPDGRMAGIEQRCECGASWGEVRGSTPAEALDAVIVRNLASLERAHAHGGLTAEGRGRLAAYREMAEARSTPAEALTCGVCEKPITGEAVCMDCFDRNLDGG